MTFSGGFGRVFRPVFDPGPTARNGLLNALVAYWKLDETTGTRNDSHSSNHLADNGSVGYDTGKISNAAVFAAGKYLSLDDNAALSAGDIDFTWSAWVYATSKPAYFSRIISKRSAATNACYDISWEVDIDRLAFAIFSSGGTFAITKATTFGSLPLNTWCWLCAWHDSVGNTVNIQINNGTVNSVATGTVVPNNSTAQFRIGDLQQTGSREWVGRIDEVGFWKRVLSADDRTALYNAGAGLAYANFTT